MGRAPHPPPSAGPLSSAIRASTPFPRHLSPRIHPSSRPLPRLRWTLRRGRGASAQSHLMHAACRAIAISFTGQHRQPLHGVPEADRGRGRAEAVRAAVAHACALPVEEKIADMIPFLLAAFPHPPPCPACPALLAFALSRLVAATSSSTSASRLRCRRTRSARSSRATSSRSRAEMTSRASR